MTVTYGIPVVVQAAGGVYVASVLAQFVWLVRRNRRGR